MEISLQEACETMLMTIIGFGVVQVLQYMFMNV